MNRYKIYKVLAILAGIVVGLVGTVCVAKFVFNRVEENNMQVLRTDFTVNVMPYLRQNIKDSFDVEEDEVVVYDEYNYTKFGQPLDDKDRLVLFGKTADDFDSSNTENMLQRILRKMYIEGSVNDIYDFEKTFNSKYLFAKEELSDIPSTGMFIEGIHLLEDGNDAQISTELRFAILLFVKGYLGCDRLKEVEVVKESSDEWPYQFSLHLPDDTAIYTFSYNYDNKKGKLSYVVIKRRE